MTLVLRLIMNGGFSFDSANRVFRVLLGFMSKLMVIAVRSSTKRNNKTRSCIWANRIYIWRLLSSCRAPFRFDHNKDHVLTWCVTPPPPVLIIYPPCYIPSDSTTTWSTFSRGYPRPPPCIINMLPPAIFLQIWPQQGPRSHVVTPAPVCILYVPPPCYILSDLTTTRTTFSRGRKRSTQTRRPRRISLVSAFIGTEGWTPIICRYDI